jgi:hypothetical protein
MILKDQTQFLYDLLLVLAQMTNLQIVAKTYPSFCPRKTLASRTLPIRLRRCIYV